MTIMDRIEEEEDIIEDILEDIITMIIIEIEVEIITTGITTMGREEIGIIDMEIREGLIDD